MEQFGHVEITSKDNFGNGNKSSSNTLSKVNGLSNITRIAAGKGKAIALDNTGIVYEWGEGMTTPQQTRKISQRLIGMAAGNSQTVFVTATGTVFGYGNILSRRYGRNERSSKSSSCN